MAHPHLSSIGQRCSNCDLTNKETDDGLVSIDCESDNIATHLMAELTQLQDKTGARICRHGRRLTVRGSEENFQRLDLAIGAADLG